MARIPNINSSGYANLSGHGVIDVKKFGAKGDYTTDDRAAIQDAILAASSTPYGVVHFPPGGYNVDGQLNCSPAVCMTGVPFSTHIRQTNGTADTFVFNSNESDSTACFISNLNIYATVNNTGRVIYNSSGTNIRMIVDNCAFNNTLANLKGNLFYITANSEIQFQNCRFHVAGSGIGMTCASTNARIMLNNNYFRMPATYSSSMVFLSAGLLTAKGNYFELDYHTSGSGANCFSLSNDYTTNTSIIEGNTFYTAGGPQVTAISADSGSYLISGNNEFINVTRHAIVPYALGSRILDPYPHVYTGSGGTTIQVANDTLTWSVAFSSTAPTITMPTKMFLGQEMDLTVRNASGGTWAAVGVSGLLGPFISTSILAGQAISFKARVVSVRADGNLNWVMVGQYTVAFAS